MDSVHLLMEFGLTHQEAKLYVALSGSGSATGYELAKASGISRSNTYSGLSSLVDKGGAWLVDGKPARYRAVPVTEFCGNVIRRLLDTQKLLAGLLAPAEDVDSEYLTIKGEQNICNKIRTMIRDTETHIYLSMPSAVLEPFLPELAQAVLAGRKVVVLTDSDLALPGATVYRNSGQAAAIRIISDTASALTGSLPSEPACSCLYSQKQNLVRLLRDSMQNEIKLISLP